MILKDEILKEQKEDEIKNDKIMSDIGEVFSQNIFDTNFDEKIKYEKGLLINDLSKIIKNYDESEANKETDFKDLVHSDNFCINKILEKRNFSVEEALKKSYYTKKKKDNNYSKSDLSNFLKKNRNI